ncbi:MAG: winged helix-turn-helix transcriptional regulator [Candidatus Thorarchaeota archaeon]|nr:winged helix-turn-helix transcriptional regulator [Candidatus Thorarchaeota archaeon]
MAKFFEYVFKYSHITPWRRKVIEPINLTESDIEELSKVFQTLSDPSRLRIIEILTQDENISVIEIAEKVNL